MTRFLSFISRTYVTLVFCIVFMPMAIILVISFSADSYLSFPPSGWSLKWYGTVLGNTSFMQGFRNSAIIAGVVAALSLALGLPAAYALVRLDFPGRALIRSLVIAPLVLPAMMLGLGILMVFTPAGLVATYPGLVLAHLVMTLPFSIRILQTALSNLGTDVDEAAMTLGARPLQVFMQITLPRLTPGVIASSAIALILSFDEIVLSLFIVGPRLQTLPVALYRYVDERTDPMVAVLAVLMIALSLAIVLVVERSVGFAKAFGR
ncbi:ABC transporter permease [Neorhizobium galegae]|uniref:ABC transporter permease n=1 Tax=Neorhizobium galegae TaxID=399 RepID=UPI0006226ED0|nr:ABC transporter permease [Neorhizobium galegae]CDZ26522.1 ABC-type spermidine/putrescine transport system, permease component II [Neorhizobium galegae bv. officinalis]KAA9383495.1 ABC transporter permease [Neorhizobium galegae]KAB1111628.1 ABC transporter permease [Neorhizobium galegae]MBP2563294.1 putative spermidine/putrescine transport system permease protein [Neorhizobium galegae]MCM2500150.1 ABC transporter permease [Neorhizobium galegae]